MAEKIKKHTGFHYLLINRLLCIFIFFLGGGFKYILKEVLSKIKEKSLTRNIFRIEHDDSIICVFYCIAFIEYMLTGKALLDYTNLFSPNDYEKNNKIMYKYFNDKYGKP